MAYPGGRPTIYSDEILIKTQEYIDLCEDEEVDQVVGMSAKGTELYKNKLKVNLPTIEGLAYHLNINKDTIYEWCKVHGGFSDVIDNLRAKQARELVSKGLSGDYNPTIAKVLLSKHGYSEKQEVDVTTQGEKIQSSLSAEAIALAEIKLKEVKTTNG